MMINFVDEIFMMDDTETAIIGTTPPLSIPVKYFDSYEAAKINEVNVNASRPEAHCKSADVLQVISGTSITIRGKEYYIKEMHPDGTGITILLLTEDE